MLRFYKSIYLVISFFNFWLFFSQTWYSFCALCVTFASSAFKKSLYLFPPKIIFRKKTKLWHAKAT